MTAIDTGRVAVPDWPHLGRDWARAIAAGVEAGEGDREVWHRIVGETGRLMAHGALLSELRRRAKARKKAAA